MPIELRFDVKPDAHGVIDGRELARDLISAAYQCLTPYVRGCPACSDNLFTVLANAAIAEIHRERDETGEMPGGLYRFDGDAGIQPHIDGTADITRALLEKADGVHEH
jgi:hypothetical protein